MKTINKEPVKWIIDDKYLKDGKWVDSDGSYNQSNEGTFCDLIKSYLEEE